MRLPFLAPCVMLFALSACEQANWAQQQWAAFTATPEWMKQEHVRFAPNEPVAVVKVAARPAETTTEKKVTAKAPAKAAPAEETVAAAPVIPVTEVKKETAHLAPLPAELPEPAAKTAAAAPVAATPTETVLEEYVAATGEQCRRFATHATPEAPGVIRTACRNSPSEQWAELRPLTHETLAPHMPAPAFGTAQAAPVMHVVVEPN